MNYYTTQDDENLEQSYQPLQQEEIVRCRFCWDDKKKKDRPLTFFDQANNLRTCNYCPWCGRKYSA